MGEKILCNKVAFTVIVNNWLKQVTTIIIDSRGIEKRKMCSYPEKQYGSD